MPMSAYKPLNSSRRETRVIHIENGHFEDPIRCSLEVVSLDENPSYEALSYVWEGSVSRSSKLFQNALAFVLGGSRSRSTIILHGVVVDVTVNLKRALQHLRRPDKPRIVWVDAISINQADMAERNRQVAQMGDIYRSAGGVIVWLGEQSADSDMALDALEAMAEDRQLHWNPALEPSLDEDFISEEYIESVVALLSRPWWNRLWTVQESILPQNLLFLCGTRELPSTSLFAASENYRHHALSCCYPFSGPDPPVLLSKLRPNMDIVRMLHQYRQTRDRLDILELISLHRQRQCSDPRDKIYALLGLATGDHARFVEPDYSRSVQEVYENAAVKLIERSGNLRVLSLPFPASPLRPTAGPADLPSWVPDWTAQGTNPTLRGLHLRMRRLTMYSASGSSVGTAKYRGSGRLACHATIVGTIAEIGEISDPDLDDGFDEVIESWRHMAQVDEHPDSIYPLLTARSQKDATPRRAQSLSYSDAYWLTLCASVSNALSPTVVVMIRDPDTHRNLHDAWWKWSSVHKAHVSTLPDDFCAQYGFSPVEVAAFVVDVSIATRMRRFFLTNEDLGLIGLAPSKARVGDAIAIIPGASVPYIIREVAGDGSGKCFNLIGDSYIHGIMEGEGLDLGTVEDIILI